MRLVWPLAVITTAVVLLLLIMSTDAKAHYKPGTHNATHAIMDAFCGNPNAVCRSGLEGVLVAKCEAAWYWDEGRPQEARNGQYRGMFQMGSRERKLYGHGPDPWSQAFAAYRYYVWSGRDWSPWSCKPW